MLNHVINQADCDLLSSFYSTFCHKDASFAFETTKECSVVTDNYSRCSRTNSSQMAARFYNSSSITFPDFSITLTESKLHRSSFLDEDGSILRTRFRTQATAIYDTSQWSTMRYNSERVCDNSGGVEMNSNIAGDEDRRRKYSEMRSSSSSSNSNESDATSTDDTDDTAHTITAEGDHDQGDVESMGLMEAESFSGKKGHQPYFSPRETHRLVSISPLLPKPWSIVTEGVITMHMDGDKRITRMDCFTERITVNGHVK